MTIRKHADDVGQHTGYSFLYVAGTDSRTGARRTLDLALENLAKADPRKAPIVESRFFGGLSVDETAESLSISTVTVKRDWQVAKAWLHSQLAG